MTTTTAVAVIPVPDVPGPLAQFRPSVESYIRQSRAESTLKAYHSHWIHFTAWCFEHSLEYLPATAETVCSYLSWCADSGTLKAGSIQCRVSAIACMTTAAGHESPTTKAAVKLTISGIRRALGTMQVGKTPTLTSDIGAMVATLGTGTKALRDRALLLVGFAGAFRRSELTALDIQDLEFGSDGVRVLIRRSKTDQEGAGQTVGIAFGGALCPVKALQNWLQAAGITSGPVFRRVTRHRHVGADPLTSQTVARVVKACVKAAGLDPARYAGHSLRAGLVTSAALAGCQEFQIMAQTRHKSSDMLKKYIRQADLFKQNVSGRVGL